MSVCPTCGTGVTEQFMYDNGICVTAEDHMREAQRLANADPTVSDPEEWNDMYRNNLLASIAHSFVAQNLMDVERLT